MVLISIAEVPPRAIAANLSAFGDLRTVRGRCMRRCARACQTAGKVRVNTGSPRIFPHFVDRLGPERRAADQHVERAKFAIDRIEKRLDAIAAGKVSRHFGDAASAVAHAVETVCQRSRIAADGRRRAQRSRGRYRSSHR